MSNKTMLIFPEMTKYFFLLLICFFSKSLYAQTAPIAHKSHSGHAELPKSNDGGFGIAPDRLLKVIKLNDSIGVFINDTRRSGERRDTFDAKTEPIFFDKKIGLDSLKKLFGDDNIIFEGFDTEKQTSPKESDKGQGFIKPYQSDSLEYGIAFILMACVLAAFAHFYIAKNEGNV